LVHSVKLYSLLVGSFALDLLILALDTRMYCKTRI